MEFFSEKLTWLVILYNKMHCHKKNYFKLRKVKSEKSLLQKSYDWLVYFVYQTFPSQINIAIPDIGPIAASIW